MVPCMPVLVNDGFCAICQRNVRFVAKDKWLRDWYVCSRCGTAPRQRATAEVLNLVRPEWRDLAIHESSPCINFYAEQCPGYSRSYYFEGVPLGSRKDGELCQNLECLTFTDGTFDVFITQDVLEHVFNPDLVVREIMRVLKPGGVHVFTTPSINMCSRAFGAPNSMQTARWNTCCQPNTMATRLVTDVVWLLGITVRISTIWSCPGGATCSPTM
jgi:SAM-dependent methyltransferase